MTDTTEELRVAARSIALAGINGWGNLCNEAADTIDTLRDENKRLEADVKEMRKALIDATAHLIEAASAYETYAKRSWEKTKRGGNMTKVKDSVTDALGQGVREELSIGKAINRAARDLPEGWEIRIDLERGAGVVHLTDPEGNETMIDGSGELFSDQINAAIDAARGAQGESNG